jgi:hypothetical protein
MKNFILLLILFFAIITGCKHSTDPAQEDKTLKGWQLDSTNTGLAGVGIDKNSLPLYDGPDKLPAGTTINMKKVTVISDMSAGNITFDRCWLVVSGNPTWLNIGASTGTLTIRDCDIQAIGIGGHSPGVDAYINNQLVTILRCNVYGFGAIANVRCAANIQNCYAHDFSTITDEHIDGITRRTGFGQMNVINNFIILGHAGVTGAVFFQDDNPGNSFDNVLIQGNLLTGYAVLNIKNKNGGHDLTNMIMDNNRFRKDSTGYGYTQLKGARPDWTQWTNNYVNDPTQPDNKGAVVNKPPATLQ